MDGNIAETLFPKFRDRGWTRVGDILWLEERRYDHIRSRVEADWTFVRNGELDKKTVSIRLYTDRELCQMFEQVDLVDCWGYGSVDLEPFKLGARRLYLVGTKSGD